jgi:hypothetical protein
MAGILSLIVSVRPTGATVHIAVVAIAIAVIVRVASVSSVIAVHLTTMALIRVLEASVLKLFWRTSTRTISISSVSSAFSVVIVAAISATMVNVTIASLVSVMVVVMSRVVALIAAAAVVMIASMAHHLVTSLTLVASLALIIASVLTTALVVAAAVVVVIVVPVFSATLAYVDIRMVSMVTAMEIRMVHLWRRALTGAIWSGIRIHLSCHLTSHLHGDLNRRDGHTRHRLHSLNRWHSLHDRHGKYRHAWLLHCWVHWDLAWVHRRRLRISGLLLHMRRQLVWMWMLCRVLIESTRACRARRAIHWRMHHTVIRHVVIANVMGIVVHLSGFSIHTIGLSASISFTSAHVASLSIDVTSVTSVLSSVSIVTTFTMIAPCRVVVIGVASCLLLLVRLLLLLRELLLLLLWAKRMTWTGLIRSLLRV